jgi:hypothetical protein
MSIMHAKVSAPAPRTARQKANVGQNNKLTACHCAVLWPHVANNVKIKRRRKRELRRGERGEAKAKRCEGKEE